MTDRKPWHCPSCNAYHGPHVDTCPKPTQLTSGYMQNVPNSAIGYGDLRSAQNAASQFQNFTGVQG